MALLLAGAPLSAVGEESEAKPESDCVVPAVEDTSAGLATLLVARAKCQKAIAKYLKDTNATVKGGAEAVLAEFDREIGKIETALRSRHLVDLKAKIEAAPTQLATFAYMVHSRDPGLREVALAKGLAARDGTPLQALAIPAVPREGQILFMIPAVPAGAKKKDGKETETARFFAKHATIPLKIAKWSPSSGAMTLQWHDVAGTGHLNGRTLTIEIFDCTGSLSYSRSAGVPGMQGTLKCEGMEPVGAEIPWH